MTADERDLDAPTPPGGPLRQDAPEGSTTPGEPAKDPGSDVDRVTRDEGSTPGTASVGEPPQPGDEAGEESSHEDAEEYGQPPGEHEGQLPGDGDQGRPDAETQEYNAETSQAQPSS